jgi:hypothetical protein
MLSGLLDTLGLRWLLHDKTDPIEHTGVIF